MLLCSRHNTDYADQLNAQYWLSCSAVGTIPRMLHNSKQNTDYAAQLYAQYGLCCSALCSIRTMLLSSKPNNDCAAQLYAQFWLCCSAQLLNRYHIFEIKRSGGVKYATVVRWRECSGAKILAKKRHLKHGAVAHRKKWPAPRYDRVCTVNRDTGKTSIPY